MNLFTRITATIGATAETAVSRFENHDAIAQSALVEVRQALAKAGIRHRGLARTLEDIRSSIKDCEKRIEQWTTRAQQLARSDESRALQCLEQRQICREQLDNYTKNLSKHEVIEARMAEKLKHMNARLQGMTNQRNEMRSRESIAKATKVMDRVDNQSNDGVEAIFERWELNISDAEVLNQFHQDDDSGVSSIQQEMDEQDRKDALKSELTDLLVANQETSNE